MTKTVKELELEWRAAVKASAAARDAEFNARKVLEAAQLEATGLNGHKVSYQYKTWRKPDETRHILVDSVHGNSYGRPRVSGKRILKDGTLGSARGEPDIADVTDCGLWVAPEAGQ